jgi:hypothetical protein
LITLQKVVRYIAKSIQIIKFNYIFMMKKKSFYSHLLLAILLVNLCPSCNSKNEEQKTTAEKQITVDSTDPKNNVVKTDVPQKLSPEELKLGQQNYLLPAPGVVFDALDKLNKVEWSKQTNFAVAKDYTDDFSRSFALGKAVADAFICIEAENKEKLGEMNTIIFDLSKEIGLERFLTEQKAKLAIMLKNQDWDSLKNGLGKVHDEVTNSLKTNIDKGDDYLILASIGGWIEGASVITNLIATSGYSKDATLLIKQPDLLKYLINSLNASKAEFPQKKALQENLTKILVFFSQKEDLSRENLSQINSLAKTIINQF